MLCTLTFILALLALQFQRSRTQCILPNSTSHSQIRDVLEKVLLHQDHPRCSSLDTAYQRLVCEIWDEADEISLRHMTCSTGECGWACGESGQRSFLPCPDGSFNGTCLPHDDGESYTCACQSTRQRDSCPDSYQWDSEWRDMTSGQPGLFRQLCDQVTHHCVATEYLLGVAHLVEYIPLPIGQNFICTINTPECSSLSVEKVRTNYLPAACGWPTDSESLPQIVTFDFMKAYEVLGVLIRANYLASDRPTKLDIMYSSSPITGYSLSSLAHVVVVPEYGNTVTCPRNKGSFTYFWEEVIAARYWTILILEGKGNMSMKADFIGRV